MKINKKLLSNNIKNIDIMTISLNSDFTISSTNTQLQVTGFSIASQIGNKLTFSNNKIVVSSGVKKVLVSYNLKHLNGTDVTRTFSYLKYNDDNISQEAAFFAGTNNQITVSIIPQLIDVQAGDTFWLAVYGAKNNKVGGVNGWRTTSLTVEVVEYDD